jgi:hypothetical protein
MVLFLFFYAPGFFLFLLAFDYRTRNAWYKQYNWKQLGLSFVQGCTVFAAIALIQLSLGSFFVPVYRPAGFFYFNFFLNYLLNWGALLGSYLLFNGLKPVKLSKSVFENFLAYVTGFYFLYSILIILMQAGEFSFVYLFFLPLLNWALIVYTSLLLERAYEEYGFLRGLFIAACILCAGIAATILYLYVINYYLPAVVLVLAFFSGSFFLYRFLKHT